MWHLEETLLNYTFFFHLAFSPVHLQVLSFLKCRHLFFSVPKFSQNKISLIKQYFLNFLQNRNVKECVGADVGSLSVFVSQFTVNLKSYSV